MGGTSGKIQRGTPGVAAAVAVCLMVCCAGEARAASVDYTLSDHDETSVIWSTGGPNSTIEGRNIAVKDVLGLSTPMNAGEILPFTDALFAFTSGTFSNANGNLYTYGSGGTFNVKGSFDFDKSGTIEAGEENVTLLSGTIGSLILDKSNTKYSISNAALSVTDYALASYFGYPAGTLFTGAMNLAFNTTTVPDEFQGGGTSGNISTSPVPVPGAAMLLFSGLAGLFGFRRKASDVLGAVG